ncbi:TVP38/TMEM64 family protein [Clostridium sediminicola]|uniref:TVP38/TMEM64 family protein n=1 Tax=Clostridium sediminicola TaxID=3114879 RepID=UPI0031F24B3E
MFELIKDLIKNYKPYIIFFFILIFFSIVGYEYYKKYFYILKDPQEIKQLVMSYGNFGYIVFLIIQIVQVVAFFIPGEIIQIASGYIYGTFLGSIASIMGITLGSMIVYTLSFKFGKPFVKKIISEKDLKLFSKILQLGSMKYIVFLIYLIPGLPKDVLGYFCGIADINFKDFIIYSTIGRVPGIVVSAYFGHELLSGKNHMLVFIAVTMSILFIVGVFRGERIIRAITRENN